ncbi:MAG: sugar phosphate isomerase/epimerase family protein, partial [bacterium]
SAITTGQAYGLEGISLSSPEEERRQKALERIKDHAHLAGTLDANAVIIIGSMRGTGANKDARFLLRDALHEFAGEYPTIKFALEPLNRYESSLINTVEEALGMLDEVNLPNIGLLFDTFHANIEERSFTESIRSAAEKIFHVHVADSNRFVPGHGHLDFAEVGAALREIGYQGFCSLESLPKPNPEKCLDYAANFIGEL